MTSTTSLEAAGTASMHELPAHGGRAAIRGAILGNFVDQFDIFLPVLALAPAAAAVFGPGNVVTNAGLIFVATLLGRPIGAAVFGPLADRIGRTPTTKISIAGVAISTALMALIPSALGPATLLPFLALRFLGGAFIGGGYTAAVPLAMEWTRERRRGTVSGLIMSMSPLANATIAGLVFALLAGVGPAAYSQWGWRIPFLLGALVTFAMLIYYRTRVSDRPRPAGAPRPADAARPRALREALAGQSGRALAGLFVLMSGLWLFTDTVVAVLPGQLKSSGRLGDQSVSLIFLCATLASAVAMVALGRLSTRIGRRRFFVGFGVLSAVAAPVVFVPILPTAGTAWTLPLVALLQLLTISGYGPVAAYLAERFPAAVRSTGYGLAYSLSLVLPALYPYYLPPLQHLLGEQTAVALLIALGGVLVAVGAAATRRQPSEQLRD